MHKYYTLLWWISSCGKISWAMPYSPFYFKTASLASAASSNKRKVPLASLFNNVALFNTKAQNRQMIFMTVINHNEDKNKRQTVTTYYIEIFYFNHDTWKVQVIWGNSEIQTWYNSHFLHSRVLGDGCDSSNDANNPYKIRLTMSCEVVTAYTPTTQNW